MPCGELIHLHLAKAGPDRLLDLRPVGTKRRWRQVEPFALFEPAVEELAEGRSYAIGSSRACWSTRSRSASSAAREPP